MMLVAPFANQRRATTLQGNHAKRYMGENRAGARRSKHDAWARSATGHGSSIAFVGVDDAVELPQAQKADVTTLGAHAQAHVSTGTSTHTHSRIEVSQPVVGQLPSAWAQSWDVVLMALMWAAVFTSAAVLAVLLAADLVLMSTAILWALGILLPLELGSALLSVLEPVISQRQLTLFKHLR